MAAPRVARADDLANAVALVHDERALLRQIQVNAPDMTYRPGTDDNASSSVSSSGTSNGTDSGRQLRHHDHDLELDAGWRYQSVGSEPDSAATARNADYEQRLATVRAHLAELPPELVSRANAQVDQEERDFNPLGAVVGVPALLPRAAGTKLFSVGGHHLCGRR